MRNIILLLIGLMLKLLAFSQLADAYQKSSFVKTVDLRTADGTSKMYMPLGSVEFFELHFDWMGDDDFDITYELELRNADWSVNDLLNPQQYIDGFNSGYINDYDFSYNTKVTYTHFKIRFPETNYQPQLSGNYFIKVYNNDELIIQQPFVVYENVVPVGGELILADDIKFRESSHQINAVANLSSDMANSVANEFSLSVYQNNNPYTGVELLKNPILEGKQLWYGRFGELRFEAGNEFRNVSFRDIFRMSPRVYAIQRDRDTTAVVLYTDQILKPRGYLAFQDINGAFVPENQNGVQPDLDSDYCKVRFTFNSPFIANSALRLYGKAFLFDPPQLEYLPEEKMYYVDLLLKQGWYDYQYLTYFNDRWSIGDTEGNYMRTENTYQLVLYRREFGTRYDRVVGYIELSSFNKF